jgi:hypothetical protein
MSSATRWDPDELGDGEEPVKIGAEGPSFEAAVALLVLLWLSEDANKFHDFKFGVQLQKDADKFDDVVFGIQHWPNSDFKYSMIQLKHKSIDSKYPNLEMQDIVHRHNPQDKSIPKCKPNVCLKVYFDSYRKVAAKQLKKQGEFVDGTIEDFVLLTNRLIAPVIIQNLHLEESPFYDFGNVFKGKCYKFIVDNNQASQLMTSCDIPRDQLPEFKEFLTKFMLSIGQPNDREIKFFLREKLGKEFAEAFCAIIDFSLKWNRHKWIQKRQLFNRRGIFLGKQLTVMSEILNEELYTHLNQETILKLFSNRLEIGKPQEETESMRAFLNFLEHLYSERLFKMQNEIDPRKLEEVDDSNDEFHILEEVEQRVVMLPRIDESCSARRQTSKNIHYFKRQNGKLFWERTKGRIDKVLDIRTQHPTFFDFPDLLRMNETKPINILTGRRGIGKSVEMSHLAQALNEKNFWVVKIDLAEWSRFFSSSDKHFASTEACLNFLFKNYSMQLSSFDREVFKRRGAILLDGFDELCPSYKEECFQWIKGLSQLKINQIWITARTHLQSEMETKFSSMALTFP